MNLAEFAEKRPTEKKIHGHGWRADSDGGKLWQLMKFLFITTWNVSA